LRLLAKATWILLYCNVPPVLRFWSVFVFVHPHQLTTTTAQVVKVRGDQEDGAHQSDSEYELVEFEGIVSQSDVPSVVPGLAQVKQDVAPPSPSVSPSLPPPPSEVGEDIANNKDDNEDLTAFHDAQVVPQSADEQEDIDVPLLLPVEEEEERPSTGTLEQQQVPQQQPPQATSNFFEDTLINLIASFTAPPPTTDEDQQMQAIMRVLAQPSALTALARAANDVNLQAAISESAKTHLQGGGNFFRVLVKNHLLTLLPVLGSLTLSCPEMMALGPVMVSALFNKGNNKNDDEKVAPAVAPREPHPNVVCDGCESSLEALQRALAFGSRKQGSDCIYGVRYKSVVSRDYDLCEACEESGEFDQAAAPFIKIKRAAPARVAPPPPVNVVEEEPARREEPVASAAPAPAAKPLSLGCPQKHVLRQFCTPHGQFKCNACGQRQAVGTNMYGCRPCDFDICPSCVSDKSGFGLPQAKFVADITLTDGAVVNAGESYIKTWRVRNSSPGVVWPADARLVNIGGNPLGAPVEGFPVPQARPGEVVDISCSLTMPLEPGKYTSFWRLVTGPPSHARFGHRMWVTVNVRVPEPVDEHTIKVSQVVELGFTDVNRVVEVLEECNGDVTMAVDRLLAESGGA
jgi:hypothetical protein